MTITLSITTETPTSISLTSIVRLDTGTELLTVPVAMTLSGGLWSYTFAEPAAGIYRYTYVVTWSDGQTNSEIGTKESTVSQGYYAKYATMRRKVGPLNLAAFSNLDASGQVYTEDSTIVQEGMDEADRYVDTAAREAELIADSAATSPHMIATTNLYFGSISDCASAIADAEIYRARGLTGDATNNAEGQMADMDKRARADLAQIFVQMRKEQLAMIGTLGAEVIKLPCPMPVGIYGGWGPLGWW